MSNLQNLYLGACLVVAGCLLVLGIQHAMNGNSPMALGFIGMAVVLVVIRAVVHRRWRSPATPGELGPTASRRD